MKKLVTMASLLIAGSTLLTACGNSGSKDTSSKEPKTEKAVDKTSKKAPKKVKDTTTIPTDDKHEWFFKNDIFYAGMETMTLKGYEIKDGIDNAKVLVIKADILNNSKEEQDPSNFYMVVHAKQKTETSNVSLQPGMLDSDNNGDTPYQAESDLLNNSLLPGKTISTVLMFELKNDNPVTLEFSNADFETIGTKVIDLK